MPSLAQLTDAYIQPDTGLPVEPLYVPNKEDAISVRPVVDDRPEPMPEIAGNLDEPTFSKGTKIGNKLFGLAGEERYQTWPEKLLRSGLTAPGDALSGQLEPFGVDPVTGDVHTSPQMIERAQDVAALSGTGGLAGADATLGSAPFLRPALKYENKIYKAPVNGQHLDALPSHLAEEFNRQAMSGEDISNFNFGFMNHKGQFLDRQAALDYAIKEGLVDPHAGQYGALTSTLLADSSKPGTAIEAMAKSGHNEGLSYLLAPKSQAMGIGEEAGKFNPNGFSTFKVNAPEGYLGHRIVYSENGKTLGAMQITKTPDGKPTVANTYVAPEARRQGIATKLNNEANKVYGKLERSEGPSKAGQAFRDSLNKPAQPFYSALEHNVNQITQSKMTGDQWLGTLANKPGVKPEELQWTGTQDFLKERGNQPVTKAELQEHLQGNKVELKEVNKADKVAIDPVVKFIHESFGPASQHIKTSADIADARKFNAHFRETTKGMSDEEVLNAARASEKLEGIGDTKYHSYQLPGGENYREMLLTLPNTQNFKLSPDLKAVKASSTGEWVIVDKNKNIITQAADKQTAINRAMGATHYKSSHWDEPNILAHVRMNDRYFPDAEAANASRSNLTKYQNELKDKYGFEITPHEYGKLNKQEYNTLQSLLKDSDAFKGKKSLHLEEIQSDWHQQGRDKGYASSGSLPKFHELDKQLEQARSDLSFEAIRTSEKVLGSSWQKFRNENPDPKIREDAMAKLNASRSTDAKYLEAENKVKELEEARSQANPVNKVPDAPFKKSWHELALKRMIREAAEKGYDRLSWTPGEAQAARYDLSKSVDTLKYNPDTQHIIAFDKSGNQVINKLNVEPKDLPDVVGKEVADKLMKAEVKDKLVGGSYKVLNNTDLKIGGEGMKGFYDQIIPKAIEKIGKEHGVKVKTYVPKKVEASPEAINKLARTLYETYDRRGGEPSWEELGTTRQQHYKNSAKEKSYLADNPEHTIHYIDIPQSLRDTAMHKGFPLFSGGYQFIPVVGNPFEDKKK